MTGTAFFLVGRVIDLFEIALIVIITPMAFTVPPFMVIVRYRTN